jgi:hypothetical protein
MSFVSRIVRKVTGSLMSGSRRTNLKYPSHEDGKLRNTNIADLRNPRFTKDQFQNLMAKSTGAEHSAGQIAEDPRFRR